MKVAYQLSSVPPSFGAEATCTDAPKTLRASSFIRTFRAQPPARTIGSPEVVPTRNDPSVSLRILSSLIASKTRFANTYSPLVFPIVAWERDWSVRVYLSRFGSYVRRMSRRFGSFPLRPADSSPQDPFRPLAKRAAPFQSALRQAQRSKPARGHMLAGRALVVLPTYAAVRLVRTACNGVHQAQDMLHGSTRSSSLSKHGQPCLGEPGPAPGHAPASTGSSGGKR